MDLELLSLLSTWIWNFCPFSPHGFGHHLCLWFTTERKREPVGWKENRSLRPLTTQPASRQPPRATTSWPLGSGTKGTQGRPRFGVGRALRVSLKPADVRPRVPVVAWPPRAPGGLPLEAAVRTPPP